MDLGLLMGLLSFLVDLSLLLTDRRQSSQDNSEFLQSEEELPLMSTSLVEPLEETSRMDQEVRPP